MYPIRTVYEYLENTAARLPDKIAFADEKTSITFGDLHKKSKSVGTAVLGISTAERGNVAVIVDRTAVSVLGIMSSLAAGYAYVPVDNKMPLTRAADIIEQVHPTVILFSEKDRRMAQDLSRLAPILCIEEAADTAPNEELLTLHRRGVIDIDPAYIIFTSGSTGQPKGILISHRALIDFTECMIDFCDTTEDDALGNQSPFYFDTSIKDIYQTLAVGCTTHILPKKLFMFPMMLMDHLNDRGVTALFWSASAFKLVAESGVLEKKQLENARLVVTGGEALHGKHLNRWRAAHPSCRFMNHYGPTEVTVDCTMYEIDRDFADDETVPIGKACRNKEIILLDEKLKPVSHGEPGEICVRGTGLALGYIGDPEKTAAAFIQNPLNHDYPDRLYRTGDIAKYNPDGDLVFLSRKDDQIKHMGYRIELGEVETALLSVAGVEDGICFFDKDEDKIVCVLHISGDGVDISRVAGEMKSRVPSYMLPNIWRAVDQMPHNPNGKIDRKALKEQYFNEKN